MKTAQITFALLAIMVVGIFMGWLIGASNSPVVSAVLPLVFSLIGGIGLGYMSFLGQRNKIKDKLKEINEGVPEELSKLLGFNQFDLTKASITWSIATIVFCVACFGGIRWGMATRMPEYPPLAEWLPTGHDLSPTEIADAHRLRLILHAKGLSTADAKMIFKDVLNPIIDQSKQGGDFEGVREIFISEAVDKFANPDIGSGGTRGPASVPPEDPPQ